MIPENKMAALVARIAVVWGIQLFRAQRLTRMQDK
jgi:hypothetical protein